MRVYKYTIEELYPSKVHHLKLPRGYKILKFGVQEDKLVFWAIVDEKSKDLEDLNLWTIWTGQSMPPDSTLPTEYLDTVTIGELVWHVFKITEGVTQDA